jgi:hypothetical protein
MPVIDEDGASPEELALLGDVLARDPALRAELELILPALDPAARRALRHAIVRAAPSRRPAAVLLEALVAAAAADRGRPPRNRA